MDQLCCSVAFTHTSCYTVSVFVSFPPASASYILLQFAQYGNILRHTVRHTLNTTNKNDSIVLINCSCTSVNHVSCENETLCLNDIIEIV